MVKIKNKLKKNKDFAKINESRNRSKCKTKFKERVKCFECS